MEQVFFYVKFARFRNFFVLDPFREILESGLIQQIVTCSMLTEGTNLSSHCEAPTACGGGGTPAPAAVRPRRETTGSGYGSALPKPKKASAVKKPAAREAAATSAATAIVEAARTAETTQVDSGATALLAAAAVLVSPPPSSQTQPLVQDAVNTGPTGTRVQQQARSAILPVIFVPQVPS